MTKNSSLISVEKRIQLHLLNYKTSKYKYDVPNELTQNGIAKAVGTSQSHISDSIRKLVANKCVRKRIGRANRGKRKQKYYFLTEKGEEDALKLKKELSNLQITLKHPNGTIRMIKLKEIKPYLEKEGICSGITDLDIYTYISREYTFDIEHLKKYNKMQYHDFSAEAPEILHFFGRKNEMAILEKWVENRKEHNIIFIYGMAGIGKTTLAAKFIEKYRSSKHLFWYSFQKLDTLGGVLLKLSNFLCNMGSDHLQIYLKTRTSYDYYEISKILGETIGNIDAVLIFDDFHKSNGNIRDFFVYFLRMLSSSSKTKMLILSREMVPFYDRRDVVTKKIVSELELEGLDFQSSKKLLKEKGIKNKMFKEVYKLTAGNPLFLEFFESKDDFDKYMHDELFLKLKGNEREILEIFSIYRFPIQKDSLSVYDDFDFKQLYALRQKSIVKKDARDRYFVHDIIKQFFYSRLSPSKRRKYHLIAARCYEKRDDPNALIEAIYHYQEAGKYKKASQFAINSSESILNGGYASDFLVILERFDEKNVEDRIWAEILNVKGKVCNMCGKWKKSLLYYTQSADIAAIIVDKKLEVKSIYESGHILEEQNRFDEAMDCFKKCLGISKNAGYSLGIGMSYRGIGRVYWRRSEHEKAIFTFRKSLKISEKLDDSELITSTYIDLGNVYDDRYEPEKAVECYNKSLEILKKVKNTFETARAYGNLAVTYEHLEEFEKAIEYNAKQLTLARNLNDIKLIGYGHANISYCFAKIEEFKKARKHAKKAEEIALKIDSENIMFMVYKTQGLLNKHEERWSESVAYFKKSIEIVEKLNALYYLSDSHFQLGLIYEEMGDVENAKKHLDIAEQLYNKLGLEKVETVKEKLSRYRLDCL
jgi:tetratricopeptide (TPR) repeat protein/DNA-binding MarR family transcriptional regulator/GTPase SAR1 family protein